MSFFLSLYKLCSIWLQNNSAKHAGRWRAADRWIIAGRWVREVFLIDNRKLKKEMHRKRPKYMISFWREEVWLSTWLGVGDGKHVGVLHSKVLGELQALRAVRLRRQGNTSVVNVLTGAHGGRLQVPPRDLCSWVAVPALLYFTQRAASPH